MDEIARIDLGFVGTKFTWENRQTMLIKEQLDRAVANFSWVNLFPGAVVNHLPKERLDHTPIIVKLGGDYVDKR